MSFEPLQNEVTSYSIDNLTFENHADGLSIYGDVQILRDLQGIQTLQEIKTIIDQALAHLQQQKDLPEQLILGEDNEQIDNPFL